MGKHMNKFVAACVAGALLVAEASPTMALPLGSNGAAVKQAAPESMANEVRWHRYYGWRRYGWGGWGYPYYYGYYGYPYRYYGYPYRYYRYPYRYYGYPFGYYGWRW
jgi:hypothetical protein